MNIKTKLLGSGDYQHVTLGDLRKLLKQLEPVGDEVELRIRIDENEGASACAEAFAEGVAPIAIEVDMIEEVWITIEGE